MGKLALWASLAPVDETSLSLTGRFPSLRNLEGSVDFDAEIADGRR